MIIVFSRNPRLIFGDLSAPARRQAGLPDGRVCRQGGRNVLWQFS